MAHETGWIALRGGWAGQLALLSASGAAGPADADCGRVHAHLGGGDRDTSNTAPARSCVLRHTTPASKAVTAGAVQHSLAEQASTVVNMHLSIDHCYAVPAGSPCTQVV